MDDYDEFGNYVGALSDSEDGSSIGQVDSDSAPPVAAAGGAGAAALEGYDSDVEMSVEPSTETQAQIESESQQQSHSIIKVDETSSNQIVLHEDKKYYPSPNQIYGEEVETLVQEEDLQPISQPIIEPVRVTKFTLENSHLNQHEHANENEHANTRGDNIDQNGLPITRFNKDFLLDMTNITKDIRNLAVVGHLHHGKTSLLDMLVEETHKLQLDTDNQINCQPP